MSLTTIASASTINVQGATTIELSGTTMVNTVTGLTDGQSLLIYGSGVPLGSTGNISAKSSNIQAGYPRQFISRNGVLYEVAEAPAVAIQPAVNLWSDGSFAPGASPWGSNNNPFF